MSPTDRNDFAVAPPIAQYTIALNGIRAHAGLVAAQIQQTVVQNHINPANLVVMVGESHNQIPHALFEIWLGESLNKYYPGLVFCDEKPVSHQSILEPPQAINEENYALQVQIARGVRLQAARSYGAAAHGFAYRPMDINMAWEGDAPYIKADLPKDLVERKSGNKFFQNVFSAYPAAVGTGHNLNARQLNGLVRRDLFMMGQIEDLQTQSSVPVVAANGRNHLADRAFPDRPNLTEMLLESGKDVVTISLDTVEEYGSFVLPHEEMLSRLMPWQQNRYHGHYDLILPDCTWKEGDLSALQQKQQSAPAVAP